MTLAFAGLARLQDLSGYQEELQADFFITLLAGDAAQVPTGLHHVRILQQPVQIAQTATLSQVILGESSRVVVHVLRHFAQSGPAAVPNGGHGPAVAIGNAVTPGRIFQ